MCLAEFAANYSYGRDEDEESCNDHMPDILSDADVNTPLTNIKLLTELGLVTKRRKEAIIRFHKEPKDGETRYRNLMLYHPWRNEETDITGPYQTYDEHYNHVSGTGPENESKFT